MVGKITKKELILDGTKLAWHKERVRDWLNGERIAPITIDLALTRNCNYRCKYCYGKLQENPIPLENSKMIPRDKIFRFLDDSSKIGVKAISLVSDGESACSPHIYDTILKGKENGLDMAFGTNAAPLKKERLREIVPALTYFRFNISAGEPKRYAEIHGCNEKDFYKVKDLIKESVKIKKEQNLETTIGLQMVLLPDFIDQIMPLTKLGKELGVDYLVIKHCSDNEKGSLKVDYNKYFESKLIETLKEVEAKSDKDYIVKAKWSKILSGGKRKYTQCYGPPFIIQISGSGLVAPCGPFFGKEYKKYHIGNIIETPFREIWQSDRYWEVMTLLASREFNAHKDCGTLCLQHKVNEYLWDLKEGHIKLETPKGESPEHTNFI